MGTGWQYDERRKLLKKDHIFKHKYPSHPSYDIYDNVMNIYRERDIYCKVEYLNDKCQ